MLLAEDVRIIRVALASLLKLEPDIDVVAEVDSGDEIEPATVRTRPDVAVLDVGMPGTDGITAAARLADSAPETATLMLTSMNRPGMMRRALAARVDGVLLKDSSPAELVAAIRSVASGRRVIDGELALSAWESPDCPLTPRELEVLRLAAAGVGSGEIARKLYLSVGTVRNYLATSTGKLSGRNRVDAIRIAREAGWLPA